MGLLIALALLLAGGEADAPARSEASPSGAAVRADSVADHAGLTHRLVALGFEDVAVAVSDEGLLVTYANRVYRNEVQALQEVVLLAAPLLRDGQVLTLVPQQRGISLLAVSIPARAYRQLQEGWLSPEAFGEAFDVVLDPSPFVRRLAGVKKTNRSRARVDVVVHPQVFAALGSFSEPVRSQVNLAPEVATSLWRGMRLSAQVILPLQDELGGGVRPGVLVLQQTFRLRRQTFVSAALGYFTLDRYGVDAAVRRYLGAGRWMLKARAGYTGFATFTDRTWYYDDLERWTSSVSLGYRWPRRNLSVEATAGRFAFADAGLRLRVARRFGEVEVGFFGQVADGEENAGFGVVLPLFMSRHLKPGPVRVRSADAVAWEYEYRRQPRTVREYSMGGEASALAELDPAFLVNLIAELRGWPAP